MLFTDPVGTPSDQKKTYPAELVMVDLEGTTGAPVRVAAGAWWAAWSPAGDRVALAAPELGSYAAADDPSTGDYQGNQFVYVADVGEATPGSPIPQHLEPSIQSLEPAVWRPTSSRP